jgi:hypothetical protein
MSPIQTPRPIDPNSGEPATDQDRNDLQPPVVVSDDERQTLDADAEREALSEREDGTNAGS